MCGIVGVVRRGKDDPEAELKKALSAIQHRGPDDAGMWWQTTGSDDSSFCVGLGHVRLSILDLSPKGHQPMVGGNGNVIILNGEIYNYLEIKKELIDSGFTFQTSTDTEVVLNAYQQWGESCVERFIGMWAFAIWDGSHLFLSRDRLGKKPFYYYHDPEKGLLAFASEIKALRDISGISWRPDEQRVFRFLAFAETERDGHTFYENIFELAPGSSIQYAPGDREIRPDKYWRLPDTIIDVDEREAIRTTSELLYDSVRLRLRSDAPLGLSLSGGLDSTLLLAVINDLGVKTVPVFSTGYHERGYDETEYINEARQGLDCMPFDTAAGCDDFIHDFENIIYHLDQPSKLPGPFPQWRVAELAGRHVKVIIDGQGADELAGGYMYFLPVMWRQASIWSKAIMFPDLLITGFANAFMFRQYPLAMIWERIKSKSAVNPFLPLQKDWASHYSNERPEWEQFDALNAMLRHSIEKSSLPALLRYGDRNNMAFGVENRCPFLDHRLVEYVAALPVDLKIRNGKTKWIFRQIAKGKIPDRIYRRRMKMGFPTPVGEWFRKELAKPVRTWMGIYGENPFFKKWMDMDTVFRLLADHTDGKADHHALLWRILSTGCWLKTAGLDSC